MDDIGNTFTENNKSPNVMNMDKEDFRFIDGRRFHNAENSKYVLPNDDDEFDRLHLQHIVIRYAWQGNFASPVEHILNSEGAKVLDSGYVSLRNVMTLSLYFYENIHANAFFNLKMWCGFLVI